MQRTLRSTFAIAAMLLPLANLAAAEAQPGSTQAEAASCFLLWELGVGERRRNPTKSCDIRLAPASTFKIPHALAALDSGVISSINEGITYPGGNWTRASWQRDHTLHSAMHHSVLWYFQEIARRLGMELEKEYLSRLSYGNEDPSSGLTTFWLGQSLQITPDEQLAFLVKLYENKLPIKRSAIEDVKEILVQPAGVVINASGEHPFNAPWPTGAIVAAKTGSANDTSGRGIRWLVGHVQRGDRAFVFVSCVVGTRALAANAAIDLAKQALREERVL